MVKLRSPKPSFCVRIAVGLPKTYMLKYFKEIIAELKATTWPTRNNLVNLVLYTLVTCGIITILILGLDIFLTRVRDLIL